MGLAAGPGTLEIENLLGFFVHGNPFQILIMYFDENILFYVVQHSPNVVRRL